MRFSPRWRERAPFELECSAARTDQISWVWAMPQGLSWWLFKRRVLPGVRALGDDMSREQVRAILGVPARTWNDEEAEDPCEAWEYSCGTYRRNKVVFTVGFYRSGRSRGWWGLWPMK